MAQFVFLTTGISFLILLLSMAGLISIIRFIRKDTNLNPKMALAWAIPLVVISFIDVLICVSIIMMLPGVPSKVDATDGKFKDRIIVQWNPVAGARSYHLLRATAPDGSYVVITGSISRTSFIDTSVKPGKYYYKVVATNDIGSSIQSKPDPGHRLITDIEFLRMYAITEKAGFGKLKKLGGLGQETEAGSVSGTISYDAKFDGRAHVVSLYANYSDFSTDQGNHMVLNGPMNTETDMLGNGSLVGKVNVTGHYNGYVRYNLVIGYKKKSGGYYAVSQDGGKTESAIPWNYQ